MGLSSVFLILTLCVYIGVKRLRERTYGRCLVSLVSSLLVFYISYIVKDGGLVDYNGACVASGFVIHMSSLATFFWLSVMGFDMQKTLTSSRPQSQSRKLFMRYSAYAWGCSLSIALIALTIELLPRTEHFCHLIRPDYHGTNNLCYFNDIKRRWIYHYWVILLLTLVNSFFFLHVVISLAKNQRQNKAVLQNPDSGQTNIDRNSMSCMWLYLKLFLVMGITWIIEVIGSNNCSWLIGDIFNLLQGVFIFIITVCKRDVYKKINEACFPKLPPVGGSLRTPMSISSRGLIDSDRSTRTSILSIFSFTSIGAGSKSRKGSLAHDHQRKSRPMSLPMHTLQPNIEENPEGSRRKLSNQRANSLQVPDMEDSVSLQSNLSIPSDNSNSPSRKTSNNSNASLQLPTVQE